MKAFIVALLCVAAVFAGDYATEENVLVLTDSTFADAIAEYDYVLAEFYAPWCGHCKNLAPEWAKAATELADLPNVKLAKIDCTVEKEIASKYEIRGYPTIKFFSKANGGEPSEFEGGRTAPDIVNWLKKKTGPAAVELKTAEDVETFIGNNEVAVVFFGPSGTEEYESFVKVAHSFDDVVFGYSGEQSTAEKFEVPHNGVALFKKHDDPKTVHDGAHDADTIKTWLKDHKDPSVFGFDQKVAQKIFGEGLDALFLITGDDEAGSKAANVFKGLGKELKGKLALSHAKIEENFGQRLADFVGVAKEHLPALRLIRTGKNNLKYLFEHEITADNIKSFVKDFVDEKLKPFFKSENIPDPDNEENVKIIVGKNWEDIVEKSDQHVLVEYYAPWCGHCKSLAPIYASLATKLKDNKDVIIAKMDATANEVEQVNVQGFPTIKFYKKGDKKNPVDYEGERTEEGFLKYLKEQGVHVDHQIHDSEL